MALAHTTYHPSAQLSELCSFCAAAEATVTTLPMVFDHIPS